MPRQKVTPEQLDWIKENFHQYSIAEVSERVGISTSSVCYIYNRYGLKKTKAQKAAIFKRTRINAAPRIFTAPDNHGTIHKWITFGAGKTFRYSTYLIKEAGIPFNNRLQIACFRNGNPLDCTMENIIIISRNALVNARNKEKTKEARAAKAKERIAKEEEMKAYHIARKEAGERRKMERLAKTKERKPAPNPAPKPVRSPLAKTPAPKPQKAKPTRVRDQVRPMKIQDFSQTITVPVGDGKTSILIRVGQCPKQALETYRKRTA